MPYKYQGFGGGGPLPPVTRWVLGAVTFLAVVSYIAFAIYMTSK